MVGGACTVVSHEIKEVGSAHGMGPEKRDAVPFLGRADLGTISIFFSGERSSEKCVARRFQICFDGSVTLPSCSAVVRGRQTAVLLFLRSVLHAVFKK